MALVPSFTISPTGNPAAFTITDTSTGSDGAITDRQILLYTAANALLVPAIDFPLSAGSSITIAPLAMDQALNVVVTWNNNVGAVLYTTSLIYAFVQYGLQFLQQLTQTQISNPFIIRDDNWISNKLDIFLEIQSALNAINVGQSVFSAQSCILRYNAIIAQQNILF
jgi:hypothetical protein